MKKENKKKKSEDKVKEEQEKEESELEEKIENPEKSEPKIIREIPQPEVTVPVLERLEAPEELPKMTLTDNSIPTLEDKKDKDKDDKKYAAALESQSQINYEDTKRRQGPQPIDAPPIITPTIRREMLGREGIQRREFHMQQPAELAQAQQSFSGEEYIPMGDITRDRKDTSFKGEKTAFQTQMEKRYEVTR